MSPERGESGTKRGEEQRISLICEGSGTNRGEEREEESRTRRKQDKTRRRIRGRVPNAPEANGYV
ncbi:hypothetical protein D7Z54_17250 [Salibacterium salarium]|uniref:Uncharacterized protein n=1 Tax=Salibacterium salarium TaxID=284579 RepID=A0A3R9P6B2_9BACI|nr:hypothetical protein D7Z54_17250 [Salibacterium salarium]